MEAIADHLQAVTEGHIKRLIICIPPGHCKSKFACVYWPAWEWIDRPSSTTLFGSYDDRLALRDARLARSLVNSDLYQELFKPNWTWDKDARGAREYRNTKMGGRISFGMGSSFKTGWRADKIVVDDPLSAENRYNVGAKASVIDTWDHTLPTRVNDPEDAAHILIMQRLAYDDLAGHLIERGGYDQLILPSRFREEKRIITSIGWTDPRTQEDELLFPAMFTKKVIDELEVILGPNDFASQHMHDPAKAGGDKFRKEFFRYFYYPNPEDPKIVYLIDHIAKKEELIRMDLCWYLASLDPAASSAGSSDFSVISFWAITPKNKMILMDVRKCQLEGPDLLDFTVELHGIKYPNHRGVDKWIVEDNGIGKSQADHMMVRGIPVQKIHVPPTKSTNVKVELSLTARTYYQSGMIYHPQPQQALWLPSWEQQLANFPLAGHDDEVSSVSYAAIGIFGDMSGIIKSDAVKSGEKVSDKERIHKAQERARDPKHNGVKSRRRAC